MKESTLLLADGIINLILGIPLLFFPTFVSETFGIRMVEGFLFSGILGGVLTGIGIALIIERYRDCLGIRGLGLGGAISINLFGAGALAFRLIKGDHGLPLFTREILWVIVAVVIGISVFEIFNQFRQKATS